MDSSYVRSNCIYCLARRCENCFVFTNYFLLTQFTAEDLVSHLLVAILSFSFFCNMYIIFFFFLSVSKFQLKFCICILKYELSRKKFPIWPQSELYTAKTNCIYNYIISVIKYSFNDFDSAEKWHLDH